jgi:hypothetical protein
MYIGLDFLIDGNNKLYLSEINTGLPAGAFEYDLVFSEQFGKPSGVFKLLDSISKKNFSVIFKEYIRNLSYIGDLIKLKIWMDGEGSFPENLPKELILEDKWIQYNIFFKKFNMLPTKIYSNENKDLYKNFGHRDSKFVLKRRLGRGGKEFKVFQKTDNIEGLIFPEEHYIIQPFIDSVIQDLRMSIRAIAFCGRFICMFASLSQRMVSNHGHRFYISPGNKLDILKKDYKLRTIFKKSWEAEILFGDDIPYYLNKSIFNETISDGRLIIPYEIFSRIKKISSEASRLLMKIDYKLLQDHYNFLSI